MFQTGGGKLVGEGPGGSEPAFERFFDFEI